MFENITFQNIVDIAHIVATVVVGAALFVAFRTYYSNRNKMQFDFAKEIQNDIIGFNRELASVSDDKHERELLFERLFNSLEWLGFLINENQITNNKIRLYFKDMVIRYYEKTFLDSDYITKEQITDKTVYPEFKKLYKDYKECKYD